MNRTLMFCVSLLVAAAAIAAEDAPAIATAGKVASPAGSPAASGAAANKDAKAEAGAKALSGMSILGNQEAPKSLVIVPWKSSRLGDRPGMSKTLEDSRLPVDKDVFMRELGYYEIRTGSK
jgi:hypothetical protein